MVNAKSAGKSADKTPRKPSSPRVTKSHLSEEIMEPKYPPFRLKQNQKLFWIGNHSAVLTKWTAANPTYCFDIQLGYRFQLDEERELVEGGVIRMRKRGQWEAIDKGGDVYCVCPTWGEALETLMALSVCDYFCQRDTHLRNDCPRD